MFHARAIWILPCLAFGLVACAQFPELDHTQTDQITQARYPALIPIEPILARADQPGPDPVAEQEALTARLEGLRARADSIRGAVLTGPQRQRLEQGLQ